MQLHTAITSYICALVFWRTGICGLCPLQVASVACRKYVGSAPLVDSRARPPPC